MRTLFTSCALLSTCFSFSLFLFCLPDMCACAIFWENQNKCKPSISRLLFVVKIKMLPQKMPFLLLKFINCYNNKCPIYINYNQVIQTNCFFHSIASYYHYQDHMYQLIWVIVKHFFIRKNALTISQYFYTIASIAVNIV